VEGFPLHASLDAVSPDNPVLLTRASGHAAFVNSRAMAIAGITRDTANPPGGEILKDAEGNPTGLLRERAEGIVMSAYDRWHEAHSDVRKAIELATAECLSKGITTFEDAGSPFAVADVNIYERVFREHPEQKDLRWRIEHAQHLNAADIPRFGQMGVIAAMQGIHCTSDAPFVLLRLGPQRAEEGAYVWQKLMKSGAVVGNGTDAPVEDVSPIGKSRSRSAEGGRSCEPEQRWNLRRGHSHRPAGGRTDHNLPSARPNYLGTPSLITYRRRRREFGL
jgi:predicted amidohydrolase YtcJ